MIVNRLKEIRMREYMLSMSEFAAKLNVKLSTYSRWESGENIPSLEKALQVANILNKQVTEIWHE